MSGSYAIILGPGQAEREGCRHLLSVVPAPHRRSRFGLGISGQRDRRGSTGILEWSLGILADLTGNRTKVVPPGLI
jgi:hypothetical protein